MTNPHETYQRVQQAKNPQHAMLAIATALDEIRVMLKPLMTPQVIAPSNPWGEWPAPTDLIDDLPHSATLDNRAVIDVIDGDVIVKPVSEERQDERRYFAHDSRLAEFYGPSLSAQEFEDAYIKGGPRWLYYTNRDAVMQMPVSLRQQLVDDILLDSPSEADEIGRDILKYSFDEADRQGDQIAQSRQNRELGPGA